MPIQVQSFYLRSGVNALSLLKRPSGWLGTITGSYNPMAAGTYARYMGPELGTAQRSLTSTWASIPDAATRRLAVAQYLSDPLQRQTVAAGTWTLNLGGQVANALVNYTWRGYVALYVVNGLTGAIRATVLNVANAGSARSNTTERTVRQQLTGMEFELFTGDYLCLEVGFTIVNTSGAARAPQATLYTDGTTAITSDNAATTDAQAVLIAPVPFSLSLPQAGEPPGSSLTFEEAREQVRAAWPTGTFHDFDDPSTPDAELLAWMAQVYKSLLVDLVDIMEREMDPGRASLLKLADWRRLFSMTQNPPKVEQLRALVIARLREYGAPSSLHGVAAALGVVLGLADPTQLQTMEISAAALRTALSYTDTRAGNIPTGTGFGAGNLVRVMPWINDGGAVWNTGVQLDLTFDTDAGQQIHVKLVGPDGTTKIWSPITKWHPTSVLRLYGVEFAGKAIHGHWTLHIWRNVGSPLTVLRSWKLFVAGAPRATVGPDVDKRVAIPPLNKVVPNVVRQAGCGAWKFWWGVYADPGKISAVIPADFGAARQALSRIRHGYHMADLILTLEAIPDTPQCLPNSCIGS